jgi:hypothetical protein
MVTSAEECRDAAAAAASRQTTRLDTRQLSPEQSGPTPYMIGRINISASFIARERQAALIWKSGADQALQPSQVSMSEKVTEFPDVETKDLW